MSTNVMVVEDSPSMRSLISMVVENSGLNAIQAESAEKALELFAFNTVDIMVLDVELPGINGFELCRRIRENHEEWFPVIYLSATNSEDYIVEGLDAGGDAYVSKPINARILEAILKAMGRIASIKQELYNANKTLSKLANHDGLTQILNRRGFEDTLDRYWRQAKREESEFALLLTDVDHFKLFNDNYGHVEGDECLKRIAAALDDSLLRPIDIAARYGGEEFAVLLPNTSLEGAMTVGHRLLDGIRNLAIKHDYSKTSDIVTLSMGVAMASQADSPEHFITIADKALYRAKHGGRNQIQS